jgi:hypothetical protein
MPNSWNLSKLIWSLIRRVVETSLQASSTAQNPNDVDGYCDFIMDDVLPTMEKHVPEAKPSPYSNEVVE